MDGIRQLLPRFLALFEELRNRTSNKPGKIDLFVRQSQLLQNTIRQLGNPAAPRNPTLSTIETDWERRWKGTYPIAPDPGHGPDHRMRLEPLGASLTRHGICLAGPAVPQPSSPPRARPARMPVPVELGPVGTEENTRRDTNGTTE